MAMDPEWPWGKSSNSSLAVTKASEPYAVHTSSMCCQREPAKASVIASAQVMSVRITATWDARGVMPTAASQTSAEGKDKHHRHQRRRPPRVRLDRAKNEPDIAVQQERRRDADQRNHPAHSFVHRERAFTDVA